MVYVEGQEGLDVDDFTVDTGCFEGLGCFLYDTQGCAIGDDGDVFPFLYDLGTPRGTRKSSRLEGSFSFSR